MAYTIALSTLLDNTRSISDRLARHKGGSLAGLGLAVGASFALRDYRTYLSYGPGGLPYNVFGWLLANVMRLLSREALSTRLYSDQTLYRSGRTSGYLAPGLPPRRTTPRPQLGVHPIPQRQTSQLPDAQTCAELIAQFAALGEAAQDRGVVEIKQSLYERRHSALFVADKCDWHAVARQTRGEISHVHAGLDGSVHVVLHPEDCRRVIEAQWGQRHGLSGVEAMARIAGFWLPVNYVLLYAPRDEAEIQIVLTVVRASIAFMTGASLE